jgi:uncharacterized membrane protein
MTLTGESEKRIERYLAALRKRLSELVDEDAQDIVEEIRAHVLDKTAGGAEPEAMSATLAALGTPEELANRYRTDELLARAQRSRSPVFVFRSLLRWATLSLAGLMVSVVSVAAYCVGTVFVIFAVMKLAWPRTTGLWRVAATDSWIFWFGPTFTPPPGGHDYFGWWLVPIFLALGLGLMVLTFWFGTWSLRKFWRPQAHS